MSQLPPQSRNAPNSATTPSLRHRATAWLILLCLLLTGSLGELAAARHAVPVMIGGVPVALCGDGTDGGNPSAPGHKHGGPVCCDHCVLGAPVLPPASPVVAQRDGVSYPVPAYVGTGWMPALSRLRTPRQSQGPPSAEA